MTKMTKRMYFEAIIRAAQTGSFDVDTEGVIAFAEKEIAAMEKRNEKARDRAAEKRAEKAEFDELALAVFEVLNDEFQTIADIAAQIEGEDVTAGKVSARLKKLIDGNKAEKAQISVERDGKAVRLMGYKRV